MADRKVYDLSPDGDGWSVKKRGGQRASIKADTKAEALKKGIALAKSAGKSQLVIRKQDGVIQEERTYGGGDPPHRKG